MGDKGSGQRRDRDAAAGSVRSTINVTPLVDVVLVLLIIFMVIAPQMANGPDVPVPRTERPQDAPDGENRIVVALQADGSIWIDDEPTEREDFPDAMRALAEENPGGKVLLQGDARIVFGEVKRAMLAAEGAGFRSVGLITERRSNEIDGTH